MDYNNNLIERAKINGKLTFNPFGMSFYWCNNNCKFCYLRDYMNKRIMTLDEFQTISNNLIKWIEDNHNIIPKDLLIGMLLIGGELFCLDESYYNIMKDLVLKTKQTLEKYDLKLGSVCLCSNLLYKDLDNLFDFYDYCKDLTYTDFFSSFDLWGRFKNEEQIELWYNNVLKIIDKSHKPFGIEILLTKQGIDRYLNDEDCYEVKYFRKLLELNNKIDFGGKVITGSNQPTIDNVINFYKKIIDEYGITNIIQEFVEPDVYDKEFASASSLTMDKNGVIERYCDSILNISPDKNEGGQFNCITNNKKFNYYFDNIIGCSACKYRKHCHYYNKNICMLCYNCYNKIIEPMNCYRKKIYKYVELYRQNH